MLPGLSSEIMLETPCRQPCLVYSEGAQAGPGCTKIAALLRILWGGLAGHGSPGEEIVMCSLTHIHTHKKEKNPLVMP